LTRHRDKHAALKMSGLEKINRQSVDMGVS